MLGRRVHDEDLGIVLARRTAQTVGQEATGAGDPLRRDPEGASIRRRLRILSGGHNPWRRHRAVARIVEAL